MLNPPPSAGSQKEARNLANAKKKFSLYLVTYTRQLNYFCKIIKHWSDVVLEVNLVRPQLCLFVLWEWTLTLRHGGKLVHSIQEHWSSQTSSVCHQLSVARQWLGHSSAHSVWKKDTTHQTDVSSRLFLECCKMLSPKHVSVPYFLSRWTSTAKFYFSFIF